MSKITSYELYKVPPRWLFLKIKTDEGLIGWGEPILEGKAEVVEVAVKELMDNYVLGNDPADIEGLWQLMFRGGFYRGGPILMSALAGIDQALWDIKGKKIGKPVYELLGGKCRDKVKVYKWIGGDSPRVSEDEINEAMNRGFRAFKMNLSGKMEFIDNLSKVKEVVQRVSKLREVLGDEMDFALDFHGRVSAPMAVEIGRTIENLRPLFIEEPVFPEDIEGLKKLRKQVALPIALGERLYSRWDFKPFLEYGLVDIVQPDISHAGGITEVRKIASLAETYGAFMAIHCPLGPIAFAASLNVAFSTYNYLLQETSLGIHYNENIELINYVKNKDVFKIENGYIKAFETSGLGVDIDEEVVKEMAKKSVNWKNPVWKHEDGSLAGW
jgi:galactonate dehydratase